MRRTLVLLILLVSASIATKGQTTVDFINIDLTDIPQPTTASGLRYWFDDDASSLKETESLTGQQMLDVSALSDGMHTVHYQIMNADGTSGAPVSSMFLKLGAGSSISASGLRYWFDDDASSLKETESLTGQQMLDVSALSDGMHTVHYQIMNADGTSGAPVSSMFLKLGAGSSTSASGLRYWFDDDASSLTEAESLTGQQVLDVSALSDGMHTVHYQIMNVDGTSGAPVSSMFLKLDAGSSTSASGLRYWFDDDASSLKETESLTGQQVLDVSALSDGMHTVHYQIMNADGTSGAPVSSMFLKLDAGSSTSASGLRYWFDDDASSLKEAESLTGQQVLDVSALSDGMHTVHYQIMNADGTSGAPVSSMFLKLDAGSSTSASGLRYWFDDDASSLTEAESLTGQQMLDVSALSDGMHTVHYQIMNADGTSGAPVSSMFLKLDAGSSTSASGLRYWFDDDASSLKETDKLSGLYTFDVSDLQAGLHTLNCQVIDSQGKLSAPVARFFVKNFGDIAEGTNRIIKYQYWLNQNSQAMKTVITENISDPYTLIDLLPLQRENIQSSLFHFEITDNEATIYAKNVFHIRFYDARGYFSDAHHAFVDYSVSKKVEDVKRLNNTQSLAKPSANEIKWYQFEALVGDSVAFKTDKACSVNVFNAAGDELYAVSGGDAVKYDGCVIREDGTYYVALHDVTATQGTNVKLDFFHLEKYAVLEYSPDCVGLLDEDFVEFKLFGNGYDKLKNAYLQYADKILTPDSIVAFGRTEMKMSYSIEEDIEWGLYDIVLKFEDDGESDSLVIKDAVAIEKGEWVEPEIAVRSERSLARPYPVKVIVKNKSNVGMMYLPLNIAFDEIEAFDNVEFMNFHIPTADTASLGDYRPFFVTDDFLGQGTRALVMNLFVPQLNPGETKEFVLGFTGPSHKRFNVYAWAGEALNHPNPSEDSLTNIPSMWHYLQEYGYLDKDSSVQKVQRNGLKRLRRLRRSANTARGVANNAVGTGMAIGGIINGLRRNNYEATLRASGIGPDDPMWDEVMSHVGPMPNPDDCHEGLLGLLRHSRNNRPCPRPNPTEILNPNDPNDIIGYSAESGSKFIRKDVTDVQYTIQFENDPETATAAAHKIVVRDTLDGELFDLSTFVATGVLIGDKRLELTGEKSFVKTIDMRPRINVIAEASLEYDEENGIATWTIRSLDPMTMEDTFDYMQGVLPVNSDGNGQGELYFNIKLRAGLPDGIEISNRASITFDYENAILTPTWTNIVDEVCPESTITEIAYKNDSIVTLNIEGNDERSGVWKYDLYVQSGEDSLWIKEGELAADSTLVEYPVRNGLYYGFCVLATDSAGNMEQKELRPEAMCPNVLLGDVNGDGLIMVNDVVLTINVILGSTTENFIFAAADMNGDSRILVNDVVLMIQKILTNNVSSMSKTRKIDKDENMSLDCTEAGFTISVPNAALYTAMQFDLLLPEGTNVRDIRIKDNKSHNAIFYDKGNGKVRVAVMSMSNETFPSDDLLEVRLDAPGNAEIFINGAYMATHNGEICRLPNMSTLLHGQTTDINQTLTGDTMNDVYDLNGRLIRENATTTNELRTGVYVINGKKMIVK